MFAAWLLGFERELARVAERVRIYMPESVRYLITRGRVEEAERTVAELGWQ